MLEDISVRASDVPAQPHDPDDPRIVEPALLWIVARAHGREELFARLERALRRRFSGVASGHLEGDLLMPLRKAIGNSHRRGNLEDPAKWLGAEVIATRRGAVLTITDEGQGFDVDQVVQKFERDERYFTREGHGIAYFARTRSLVSYADGGRTWLMRFLADPEPGNAPLEEERAELGVAGDGPFMRDFLASRVPCFRDHGVSIDSCQVNSLPSAHGATELAYVLRCRPRHREPETMVLTGRLLPPTAARADVAMAEGLRESRVGARDGLHIPRPLGAFEQPALSLFHLDPSATLRDRIVELTRLGPMAVLLRVIAMGLAAIHLSTVTPEAEESLGDVLERHRRSRGRVEAKLSGSSQERAAACFELLFEKSDELQPWESRPIHGALDWDCFVGSGERPGLYRFDRNRRSHPGQDVGAFLADLLRFHRLRKKGDPWLYMAGRAAFLEAYFAGSRPVWSQDLDWFVASALFDRLDRMLLRDEEKWAPKVAPLLSEIERALE